MRLPDKAYDVLKWIALIALDAIGVCYKTLAMIWGWPFGEEVLATCAAISVCIGALIGISTAQYYKDIDAPIHGEHEPIPVPTDPTYKDI